MTKETTVIQEIAAACESLRSCKARNNTLWYSRWEDVLDWLEKQFLPSGSGFDSGTTIDRDVSCDTKVVLNTSYHHMNENGMYDGWTDHKVTVRPTFHSPDITISGRNRNDIKDYMQNVFYDHLMQVCRVMDTDEGTNEYGYYFNDVWKACAKLNEAP